MTSAAVIAVAQADGGFHPFSPLHFGVLAGYALVTTVLAALGARWRGTPRAQPLHRAWTAFVILVQVTNIIYWARPPNLAPQSSLPLHICDLAGIAAVLALTTGPRLWRIILYYWGLGLSTQAFITPVITEGPDTFRFHLFFASHLTIIASAVYDLSARRFRPTWTDLRTITLVLLAWGAIILPLDIFTGWNYGYIGNTKPDQPTLIDRLGPWPLRLLWMFLFVEGAFALMTLAWWRPGKPTPIQSTPPAAAPQHPVR